MRKTSWPSAQLRVFCAAGNRKVNLILIYNGMIKDVHIMCETHICLYSDLTVELISLYLIAGTCCMHFKPHIYWREVGASVLQHISMFYGTCRNDSLLCPYSGFMVLLWNWNKIIRQNFGKIWYFVLIWTMKYDFIKMHKSQIKNVSTIVFVKKHSKNHWILTRQ